MEKLIPFAVISVLTSGCCQFPYAFVYEAGTKVTIEQMAAFNDGESTKKQEVHQIGYPERKVAIQDSGVWYFECNYIQTLPEKKH